MIRKKIYRTRTADALESRQHVRKTVNINRACGQTKSKISTENDLPHSSCKTRRNNVCADDYKMKKKKKMLLMFNIQLHLADLG